MRLTLLSLSIFTMTLLLGCKPNQDQNNQASKPTTAPSSKLHAATQSDIDSMAKSLDVNYRLVTNIPSNKCDEKKADGACFEVELSFTAKQAITANNWSIFFSQISPIQSFESQWFQVKHINGDLHKITLKEGFDGFKANETKTLLFRANFWSLSETDALPNYIIVSEELSPKVIESTKVTIDNDTGLEILPYVSAYTNEDKQFKRQPSDKTQRLTADRLFYRNQLIEQQAEGELINVEAQIIPSPSNIKVDSTKAGLDLNSGIQVNLNNVSRQAIDAALTRLASFGVREQAKGHPLFVKIETDSSKKIGSYQLNITADGIEVTGVDASGVFYGLQSLAALVHLDKLTVPFVAVDDEPHYAFRGMLVDVARNFRSKAFILKLLDQMAAYKLNKLHLHLGDDEGWRLEIPSLPELTEVGARRCFDPSERECLMPQLGAGIDTNSEVNGYYSVADYTDILQAASARHIQVIPSLDMPGHSRAAVKSMAARYEKYMAKEQEQLATEYLLHDIEDKTKYSSVQYYSDNTINVCMPSAYRFVERVMLDVKSIHEAAGQPLSRYHIGADETAGAWVESPQCKAFLAKHNADVSNAKELGAYFVERVSNILADLGIEAAAWIDGLEHTNPNNMPAVIQANAWNPLAFGGHKPSHKVANYNWQVVVSSPDVLYFDFPYEADPKEHGYYWASRQINTEKIFQFMPDNLPIHAEFWLDREDKPYIADDRLVKDESGKTVSAPLNKDVQFYGVQGQLWSENTRTDATAEYKIFPRIFALAERAWHKASWAVPYNYAGAKYSQESKTFTEQGKQVRDRAWQQFAHTIGKKELAKLELAQVAYRLPTVGAVIKKGILHANIAYPGLIIEYQEGHNNWQQYQKPIAVKGEVKVRSRTINGNRTSRISVIKE